MDPLRIEDLYIYPIKSTEGFKLDNIDVVPIGFVNDLYFGIVNAKNEILTAIEKP